MSSSAAGGEANLIKDPDNARWWRRVPIRLESQAVRDSLLALSGQLDGTMGGPPVPTADQADSKRRSLYFFHSNNERNLFLTTFDDANVKECYRRDQSIVPQQALALSNSRLVLDCAGLIANRLTVDVTQADDAAFVRQAFRGVLCLTPSQEEIATCLDTMQAWRQLPDATPQQVRAQLIWALINHNDFVSVNRTCSMKTILHPPRQACSRRTFLADIGLGFTGLALAAMLERDGYANGGEWSPPTGRPHFSPKAKNVIWLFMNGGVNATWKRPQTQCSPNTAAKRSRKRRSRIRRTRRSSRPRRIRGA